MYGDDEAGGASLTEILGDLLDGDESEGEFVGDDESGASDADVLGAILRKHKASGTKTAMARDLLAAPRAGRRRPAIRPAPRNAREYILGLESTAVTGYSSANITSSPRSSSAPSASWSLEHRCRLPDHRHQGRQELAARPRRRPAGGHVHRACVRRPPQDGHCPDLDGRDGHRDHHNPKARNFTRTRRPGRRVAEAGPQPREPGSTARLPRRT